MRGASRPHSYRGLIRDRLRQTGKTGAGKLPSAILFAAVVGVFPLAFTLDWLIGVGWLGSAVGAIAIAALLAIGAFTLVGT